MSLVSKRMHKHITHARRVIEVSPWYVSTCRGMSHTRQASRQLALLITRMRRQTTCLRRVT